MRRFIFTTLASMLMLLSTTSSIQAATAADDMRSSWVMEGYVMGMQKTKGGGKINVRFTKFQHYGSCMDLQKQWKQGIKSATPNTQAMATVGARYKLLGCEKNLAKEISEKTMPGMKPVKTWNATFNVTSKSMLSQLGAGGIEMAKMEDFTAGSRIVALVRKTNARSTNQFTVLMATRADSVFDEHGKSMLITEEPTPDVGRN